MIREIFPKEFLRRFFSIELKLEDWIGVGIRAVMGKDLFNVPDSVQDSDLLVIWTERKTACLEHGEWEGLW